MVNLGIPSSTSIGAIESSIGLSVVIVVISVSATKVVDHLILRNSWAVGCSAHIVLISGDTVGLNPGCWAFDENNWAQTIFTEGFAMTCDGSRACTEVVTGVRGFEGGDTCGVHLSATLGISSSCANHGPVETETIIFIIPTVVINFIHETLGINISTSFTCSKIITAGCSTRGIASNEPNAIGYRFG